MREQIFNFAFSDKQMLALLQRGETFSFRKPGLNWQSIERQIERLGFGDAYFVTHVSARRGELTKIAPVLARTAA